jgi:hypothetical protein
MNVVWYFWLVSAASLVITFGVFEAFAIITGRHTLSWVWRHWEDHGSKPKRVLWSWQRFATLIGLCFVAGTLVPYLLIHWVGETI